MFKMMVVFGTADNSLSHTFTSLVVRKKCWRPSVYPFSQRENNRPLFLACSARELKRNWTLARGLLRILARALEDGGEELREASQPPASSHTSSNNSIPTESAGQRKIGCVQCMHLNMLCLHFYW